MGRRWILVLTRPYVYHYIDSIWGWQLLSSSNRTMFVINDLILAYLSVLCVVNPYRH